MQEEKIIEIDVDKLMPNKYQPRKEFNEESLDSLAKSIKEYGIINPILVRKTDDKYEIIAGERRWRAAKKIGLKKVPAIIKNIEDIKMAEMALIENLQRENLTPLEEAESIKQIIELTNVTQKDLGDKIGKSQSTIANKLRLLTLPKEIKEALNNQKISERHARSLLSVLDNEKKLLLLERIINEKLSVKELNEIIKKQNNEKIPIETTISNIMNSIGSKETKKEEKESDNMNNGNFFPNYNGQMNPTNNASLNTLNMQSINSQPINETVMPTANPVGASLTQNVTPMQPSSQPGIQNQDNQSMQNIEQTQPLFDFSTTNPIPDFNIGVNNSVQELQQPTPSQEPTLNQTEQVPQQTIEQSNLDNNPQVSTNQNLNTLQQSTQDTPPFNQEIINVPNIEQPIKENIVQDTPLFSISESQTQSNQNEPQTQVSDLTNYEVPVTTNTQEPTNNLNKVTEFLNQNQIQYKLYNNDTGHCIIIEL